MPKNILDTIIKHKKQEVERAKTIVSINELEGSEYFVRNTLSLKQYLLDESRTGIIAEFKRKSPSKGIFNENAKPEVITKAYTDSGAAGLSILTDETFFGGSIDDLKRARSNEIPILRKDFIIDEYQILEARSIGADVILLIAACLEPDDIKKLSAYAKSLNLETLLEIHDENELGHVCDGVDIVGVNNRDLKTFTVDVNRSLNLSEKIPEDKLRISESGITDVHTIRLLKQHGFNGFLIGETFMREQYPAIAFARFVNELKNGIL